jgi:putative pantetheine hydrolase
VNPYGALTDVPEFRVGQVERIGDGWLTGVTVVLPPAGTIGAVDVRGGGPGTRQTDILAPGTLVATVDAISLAGGSLYGLAAADGVQRWCEEHRRGFQIGPELYTPIVPSAILFDLGKGGDPAARPDAAMGYDAAASAAGGAIRTGCVGAGTGATVAGSTLKGGVGTASVRLAGDVVVAALVVANAYGSPLVPGSGTLLAAQYVEDEGLRPRTVSVDSGDSAGPVESDPAADPTNTTLAVVATNARLDRAEVGRLAASGHDGMARAIRPLHTLVDGDTVFGLATGTVEPVAAAPTGWAGAAEIGGVVAVQAAAADAVTLALVDALLAATGQHTPTGRIDGYLDRYPTACPPSYPRPPG